MFVSFFQAVHITCCLFFTYVTSVLLLFSKASLSLCLCHSEYHIICL